MPPSKALPRPAKDQMQNGIMLAHQIKRRCARNLYRSPSKKGGDILRPHSLYHVPLTTKEQWKMPKRCLPNEPVHLDAMPWDASRKMLREERMPADGERVRAKNRSAGRRVGVGEDTHVSRGRRRPRPEPADRVSGCVSGNAAGSQS